MKTFSKLAYASADDLIYGFSRYPVSLKNGLTIGGGIVLPELNFTLPNMLINGGTMKEVRKQYHDMMEDAAKRAYELHAPGIIAEVELLPPTTYNPAWGREITKVVKDVLQQFEHQYGLKSGLRITPVDIREDKNSPHMWHGSIWDRVMETFEGCAGEGADILSIESIGGKDIHDEAVMYCDIQKALFALGILGCRDMLKLWDNICGIAKKTNTIAGGDTACAFANTAMVLAERKYIPKVFAAVIRVMSAVRSLAAYEAGAVGPHKDCGYEGIYIKAITGTPISMEGKSSACAHLSPLGNIAAAAADLWSNESVQNIKLLGGMAPTVSMEQLIYDCRLLNTATSKGTADALRLRDYLVESDCKWDPQAYVLRPDVVFDISQKIVKGDSRFKRTKIAALAAIEAMRRAVENQMLLLEQKETVWLDNLEQALCEITDDEEQFIREMIVSCKGEKFDPAKYDLS